MFLCMIWTSMEASLGSSNILSRCLYGLRYVRHDAIARPLTLNHFLLCIRLFLFQQGDIRYGSEVTESWLVSQLAAPKTQVTAQTVQVTAGLDAFEYSAHRAVLIHIYKVSFKCWLFHPHSPCRRSLQRVASSSKGRLTIFYLISTDSSENSPP